MTHASPIHVKMTPLAAAKTEVEITYANVPVVSSARTAMASIILGTYVRKEIYVIRT